MSKNREPSANKKFSFFNKARKSIVEVELSPSVDNKVQIAAITETPVPAHVAPVPSKRARKQVKAIKRSETDPKVKPDTAKSEAKSDVKVDKLDVEEVVATKKVPKKIAKLFKKNQTGLTGENPRPRKTVPKLLDSAVLAESLKAGGLEPVKEAAEPPKSAAVKASPAPSTGPGTSPSTAEPAADPAVAESGTKQKAATKIQAAYRGMTARKARKPKSKDSSASTKDSSEPSQANVEQRQPRQQRPPATIQVISEVK